MSAVTYTTPLDEFDTDTSDVALGPEVQFDRDRPPLGSFAFGPAYDGTCFILKGNLLYYSKPKQPEAWPSLYYIEVGPPEFSLQTGLIHSGQVYVFSKIHIFYVQGTGAGTFLAIKVNSKTGAQTLRGAVSVSGRGIYHTGPDGIYLFSSGDDRKITEETLESLFRGETVEGMSGVATMNNSWLFHFGNFLYFGYRATGQAQPGQMLVMNLDTGRVSYYVYNDGSNVLIRAMAFDKTNNRLLAGDNSGFVRVIENTAYTDDSGTDIPFDIKSKDFTLQTRAHFPRWVKYDIDASNATSVTGELYLDGASHQSHTITGNRSTKRRLVGTGNGSRAANRISGTGPVSIYATETE